MRPRGGHGTRRGFAGRTGGDPCPKIYHENSVAYTDISWIFLTPFPSLALHPARTIRKNGRETRRRRAHAGSIEGKERPEDNRSENNALIFRAKWSTPRHQGAHARQKAGGRTGGGDAGGGGRRWRARGTWPGTGACRRRPGPLPLRRRVPPRRRRRKKSCGKGLPWR